MSTRITVTRKGEFVRVQAHKGTSGTPIASHDWKRSAFKAGDDDVLIASRAAERLAEKIGAAGFWVGCSNGPDCYQFAPAESRRLSFDVMPAGSPVPLSRPLATHSLPPPTYALLKGEAMTNTLPSATQSGPMIEHTLTHEGAHLANVTPARGEDVMRLVSAPVNTGDGRSEWVWVRLANGDLLLGTFPQGETYESFLPLGV